MDAKALRDELVERVVETDDELLEKFLNGEVPSVDVIISALRKAVATGRIVPVLGLSAKKDIGAEELLETLSDLAPSPKDLSHTAMKGGKETPLVADPQAPFVARVVKTQADKFGNLTYLRVYQGTLHANTNLKDSRTQNVHRLGTLQIAQGRNHEKIDEAGPGDIVCLAKARRRRDQRRPQRRTARITDVVGGIPQADVSARRSARKPRGDDLKVVQALRKMSHEDPCLVVERNDQTNETVLRGLSQLHLDVVQSRLKRRDHLELETHAPKIPYKETIGRPGEGMFRHKKQTGRTRSIRRSPSTIRPRERGRIRVRQQRRRRHDPDELHSGRRKGVREQMHKGVIAGCEVVDVTVEVHFGKYHDVDSSEAAFKYAAAMAFREAFNKCQPQLLEPIVALEVVSPADKMGDINGDLNSRGADHRHGRRPRRIAGRQSQRAALGSHAVSGGAEEHDRRARELRDGIQPSRPRAAAGAAPDRVQVARRARAQGRGMSLKRERQRRDEFQTSAEASIRRPCKKRRRRPKPPCFHRVAGRRLNRRRRRRGRLREAVPSRRRRTRRVPARRRSSRCTCRTARHTRAIVHLRVAPIGLDPLLPIVGKRSAVLSNSETNGIVQSTS